MYTLLSKVYIRKENQLAKKHYITTDIAIPKNDIFVFLLLKSLSNNMWGKQYFTIESFESYIWHGSSVPRRQHEHIMRSFDSLGSNGFIKLKVKNKVYELEQIKEPEEYVMLYCDEFAKFMELPFAEANNLLSYYISLLSTFDFTLEIMGKRNVISHMGLDYICSIADVSYNTALKYNKKLEDMGVIYIRRSSEQNDNNLYCRGEDKKYLDYYFEQSGKQDNRSQINRSMAQKYRAYMRGKEYPEDELREILEWKNRYTNN